MERELVFGSRGFEAPERRRASKKGAIAHVQLSYPTEILGGEKERSGNDHITASCRIRTSNLELENDSTQERFFTT